MPGREEYLITEADITEMTNAEAQARFDKRLSHRRRLKLALLVLTGWQNRCNMTVGIGQILDQKNRAMEAVVDLARKHSGDFDDSKMVEALAKLDETLAKFSPEKDDEEPTEKTPLILVSTKGLEDIKHGKAVSNKD